MKSYKIIGSIAGLFLFATAVRADDLEDRVKKITFFATADSVIALMQRQPDAEEATMIAGIPKTRWRWSGSNGRTVVVTMVEGRVLMTKVCTAIPNC